MKSFSMCLPFRWITRIEKYSKNDVQTLAVRKVLINICTRSVRKVSGLSLYLRAIVFERPLRGINVNSKASRTYGCLLTSAGRIVRILFSNRKNEFGNYSDDAEGLWE